MTNHGQAFLEQLATHPLDTFEGRFSMVSTQLGLGGALGRNELQLLYQATFDAARCSMALNGLGECGGEIRPEHERDRTRLEREFMVARDMLFASPGWQALPEVVQGALRNIFLNVFVAEDKLVR